MLLEKNEKKWHVDPSETEQGNVMDESDGAATHRVEDQDWAELDQAVQGHVFEETEWGNQRTSALSTPARRKGCFPL